VEAGRESERDFLALQADATALTEVCDSGSSATEPELEAAGGDVVLVDEPGAARAAARVGNGVRQAIYGVSGAASGRLVDFLTPGATLVGYAMMSGDSSTPADQRPFMSKSVTLKLF
jgi:hypothetical protein